MELEDWIDPKVYWSIVLKRDHPCPICNRPRPWQFNRRGGRLPVEWKTRLPWAYIVGVHHGHRRVPPSMWLNDVKSRVPRWAYDVSNDPVCSDCFEIHTPLAEIVEKVKGVEFFKNRLMEGVYDERRRNHQNRRIENHSSGGSNLGARWSP